MKIVSAVSGSSRQAGKARSSSSSIQKEKREKQKGLPGNSDFSEVKCSALHGPRPLEKLVQLHFFIASPREKRKMKKKEKWRS